MAKQKMDKGIRQKLEEYGKQKANELANDAEEKLVNKYISLIECYYDDYTPKLNKYGIPYYVRTFNLRKSYIPYKKTPFGNRSTYYGGVKITAERMNEYTSRNGDTFLAERLLDKYIYTTALPSATWHGGDWHGGYGVMAGFSIYYEMKVYQKKLINEYKSSCKSN
jgi:hypothetical protein